MKQNMSIWARRQVLRRISWLVLLSLVFNIIGFDLGQVVLKERLIGVPSVQAAVADRDGLGIESFFSHFSKDLGAGWQYSANTYTGNLIIQNSLVSIPGRGGGLSEGLVYNSLSSTSGAVGRGWQLANDLFVRENADASVTFKDGDATNHHFTRNGDGTYSAPAGVYLTLSKVDSTTFTIKDQANTVYRFQNGLLTNVTDENNNQTSFSYDTSNRLSTVTDPSGRALTYAYGTNGKLASITDPASRTTSFGYDGSARLTSVTDAKGGQVRFSYDSNSRLESLTDANNHATSFVYDAGGKLTKVKDARTTQAKEYATTLAYDLQSLKTTITDPATRTVTLTHNAAGNLTQIQDGAGVAADFTWSSNNLTEATDASGQTSATYDTNGNITTIVDTLSQSSDATTTATYDSKNNPTTVTDPIGNQTDAKYDSKSNLLSTGNPESKEADANTYDSYGNLTSATEPGAPTQNMVQNGNFEWLDSYGEPEFWYYGGSTSKISVDSSVSRYGDQSVKISSTSNTTAYVYSELEAVTPGQKLTLSVPILMESIQGAGGDGVGVALEYYDSSRNFIDDEYSNIKTGTGEDKLIVTSEAPAGAAYVCASLELDNAKGTVWFDGAQLERPINASDGHIITKFDYCENSSFEEGWSYWYAGGQSGAATISTSNPWAGAKSAKVNLTTSGTAWVKSARVEVDPGERLTLSGFVKTSSISGTGARVEIEYYDSNQNYISMTTTKLQTGTQDYTRYAVATTVPSNASYGVIYGVVYSSTGTAYFDNLKLVGRATTRLAYDSSGNYVTDHYDALDNWTDFAYDAAGNLTMVNDPKGQITRFAYDKLGNLTTVTDTASKVFRFDYDPASMQVAYRDGRSTSEADNTYKTTYAYNELNQITGITDPSSRTISSTYDDAGNLASVTQPDGRQTLFAYDAANRLSQKSYLNEATRFTFGYDSAGNLASVTDDQTRSASFSYDMANRLTGLTDIFNYSLNYTLDKAGNETTVTDSNNKTTAYTYGSEGQLTSLTDTSGRQTLFRHDEEGQPFEVIKGNGLKRVYLYDDAGRLEEIADPGNPDNTTYNYTYDVCGNITEIDGANESFAYDALNRLTSWTSDAGTVTFEYDAVGNLTKKGSKNYTYNAANEITNSGFSYDSNGNLTNDGTFNYTYNSENQLTQVKKVSDGSTVATYEYDFRGLRTKKTVGATTTRYHYDESGNLVRESDANGATIALYIYDGSDQLVAIEKGGAMYYTHTNHRGDIVSITDANKSRVATFKYDPWGKLISKTGTFDIPIRYAGYYYDSETGMYYLKSRYYSPELGRFLTKDTFKGFNENPQSLNLYAYCSGNPIINVDPSGYAVERWNSRGYQYVRSCRTFTRFDYVMAHTARFGMSVLAGGIARALWGGSWIYSTLTGGAAYSLQNFILPKVPPVGTRQCLIYRRKHGTRTWYGRYYEIAPNGNKYQDTGYRRL